MSLKEYSTHLREYNMPLKEYSAPIKQHEPRHIPETFSKHRIQSSPLPLEKPWSNQADQKKGHKKKSSQEKMPDNMPYSLSVPHWNRPKIKWERKVTSTPDPPENCHLNVKNAKKLTFFFKKIDTFFSTKLPMGKK